MKLSLSRLPSFDGAKIIVTLAAAALVVAGCSIDEDPQPQPSPSSALVQDLEDLGDVSYIAITEQDALATCGLAEVDGELLWFSHKRGRLLTAPNLEGAEHTPETAEHARRYLAMRSVCNTA